jgi:hypothetical protein
MYSKKWENLLENVYNQIIELKKLKCDVPYFRGQSNNKGIYHLIPRLYRGKYLKKFNDDKYLEYDMYFDFVTNAGNQINKDSTWHNLFFMQHYGLPTRLLDWTNNFGVALYFAIKNYNPQSKNLPEIVILNPFMLNRKSFNIGELINPELTKIYPYRYLDIIDQDVKMKRYDYPIALYPFRFNARMIAQGGFFTLHGKLKQGIDELVPKCVYKFPIHKDLINEANKFLLLSGINEYSIFNDMMSLCRHLENFFFN